MSNFEFDVLIQLANGLWLSANDKIKYRVGAASFNESSTQYRRTEVTSPYVAGSFLVHAVPQNVTETLEIYCYGGTYDEAKYNTEQLIAALTQPMYKIQRQTADETSLFDCFAADYSVKSSNVYVAANMIPVVFQVPRLPDAKVTLTINDVTLDGGLPNSLYVEDIEINAGGV